MLRLSQRSGVAVEFNSSIPLTDGTVVEEVVDFKIRAVADGGKSMMKHV